MIRRSYTVQRVRSARARAQEAAAAEGDANRRGRSRSCGACKPRASRSPGAPGTSARTSLRRISRARSRRSTSSTATSRCSRSRPATPSAPPRARPAARSARVLVVERGFDWDVFLAANANLGLFGSRKLVDLRIPGGKPGIEGAKALETCAAGPQPRPRDCSSRCRTARPRDAGVGLVHGARRRRRRRRRRIRSSATSCRHGSPRASRAGPAGRRRDTRADPPTAARATCLPRARRSRSWGCSCPAGAIAREDVLRAVTDVARYDVAELSAGVARRRSRAHAAR